MVNINKDVEYRIEECYSLSISFGEKSGWREIYEVSYFHVHDIWHEEAFLIEMSFFSISLLKIIFSSEKLFCSFSNVKWTV